MNKPISNTSPLFLGPVYEHETPEEIFMTPRSAGKAGHEPIAQFLPHPIEPERIGRPCIIGIWWFGPEDFISEGHGSTRNASQCGSGFLLALPAS